MFGFVQYIMTAICQCTRPLVKGILRRFTRLCELQRICYGLPSGAPRTLAVEKSLRLSRNAALRGMLSYNRTGTLRPALESVIMLILREKKIKVTAHPQFPKSFGKCIEQIWGYAALIDGIENLRKTPYDSSDAKHEEMLLSLWDTLVPDEVLEARVTKQWQHIGFQGDDPKTDFRGMGMLGLENLVYFSRTHSSIAKRILLRSQHPKYGYAFAIVGINITHLAYVLVTTGVAKTHVFNVTRSPPSLRTFHQIYCYLFVEFDKFWLSSKPRNIMDFSSVMNKFDKSIRYSLQDERVCLKLVVEVDEV